CVEQDDKGWDARKRAYCLKIQPATGSFARNLIYSTKPRHGFPFYCRHIFGFPSLRQVIVKFDCLFILKQRGDNVLICYERERYHGLAPLLTIRGRDLKGKERVSWLN
ncbi:hypothetical protein ACYBO4_19305, partial [Klebsiella pneumoniae]